MPRLEFTAPTKRAALERSNGICECHMVPWLHRPFGCGVKLGSGNTYYEHICPDAIRPDNSLSNCAVLSKTCWKQKSNEYDRKVIAKSNHTRDRAQGIKQNYYRALAGTKRSGVKLPMRPFARPIDRRTGLPLHSK